ncbi:hypothetical protein DICVIV_13999 [Dictyocaulus viviparus]|uniref:Uncharacterized protein n=1 Tax=Dictyocaulus viviparus TaxID=29172 RepID=A0A0D8X6E3_DICVI|nr:hypothetical protein DICVIV_13999 [Dictyocaulus viviparus]
MCDDASAVKTKRLGRNPKDLSREIRAKLSNINQNLQQNIRIGKLKESFSAENKISRSLQGHDVNGPSNVAERSHKIETSLKNVKKFKSETNLKTVHKTSLNDKAVPKKRKKTKGPKFPDDELKNRIADLHKRMKILQVKDPAIEKLMDSVNQSLEAIKALEEVYINIDNEAKSRMQKLFEEFEHLKTLRERVSLNITCSLKHMLDKLSNFLNAAELTIITVISESHWLTVASGFHFI